MDECQEAVEEWTEPGPGDSPKACPPAEAGCGPSRQECRPKHKGRPKSLNLPPEAKHPANAQRSFKTKTRTSEKRPKCPQEEVGFWLGKQIEGLRGKAFVEPPSQNASQFPMCPVMHGSPGHSCSPIRCRSKCRGNLVEADWQPGLPADTQPPNRAWVLHPLALDVLLWGWSLRLSPLPGWFQSVTGIWYCWQVRTAAASGWGSPAARGSAPSALHRGG